MSKYVLSDASDLEIPANSSLQQSFNAPFYTGFTLDTQGLLARELNVRPGGDLVGSYERHQAVVLERLDSSWHASAETRNGGQEFDVDNYSGRPVPPLYFLQRKLPALFEEEMNRFTAGDLQGQVTAVDIKIFDFGVGVITVNVDLWTRAPMHWLDLKEAVESMARSGEFDEHVRGTVRSSLDDLFAAIPDDWLLPEIGVDGRPREPKVASGQALWTHRVFQLPVDEAVELSVAGHEAWRCLLPDMPEEELNTVACGDMLFVPEKGSSVALFRPGSRPIALLHTIELQNAFWAAAANLDRTLLRRVAALSYDSRNCDFKQLEERNSEVVEFYERVRVFRMVMRSLVGVLSPLQYSTWMAVAEAWKTDSQLLAVDDKLDALSQLHRQLLDDAAQRRNSRLNNGVFIFTSFALAQTLFAAIAFGFLTTDGDLTVRKGVPVFLTLLIGGLSVAVAGLLLRGGRIRRDAADPHGGGYLPSEDSEQVAHTRRAALDTDSS